MRAARVACLDQQQWVRAHEGDGHRHLRAVGQDEVLAVPKLLDDAEDVVPAPRVQTAGVVPQLVKDLLHLERSEDRLDEDGGADRPAWDAQRILREIEDVVPEARLQVAFELREVKVRSAALAQQALGVVKEVQAEVEQASRNRLPTQHDLALLELP